MMKLLAALEKVRAFFSAGCIIECAQRWSSQTFNGMRMERAVSVPRRQISRARLLTGKYQANTLKVLNLVS
jgi:hypothetical protein